MKILHGLKGLVGGRHIRHDSIRDKLYQLLKLLNPGIQQTHLSMEFVVGQITNPDEPPPERAHGC
jgi:hypothetical protein